MVLWPLRIQLERASKTDMNPAKGGIFPARHCPDARDADQVESHQAAHRVPWRGAMNSPGWPSGHISTGISIRLGKPTEGYPDKAQRRVADNPTGGKRMVGE